ncbi:hypothetical protein RB195_010792 [Necator americanus]|uniref:Reverse transcriptase RNase H-like domain-containing protein n=1 Tax=Necator americanus TaxID=51031 RepID=A0ABR1CZK1_NECAM
MGATLSHRLADGCEKVIYHAGRCLTQPQKNYSKIEKEALALIFAVQKFHCSIQGRHFTLRTDHKPLLAIFESKEEFRSPVPSVFSGGPRCCSPTVMAVTKLAVDSSSC